MKQNKRGRKEVKATGQKKIAETAAVGTAFFSRSFPKWQLVASSF